MKPAKISSKKGNVSEISCRMVLAIEFKKQSLMQDIKNWNEQLASLEFSIDKIEKAVKKELVIKSQELSKEFSSSQAKIKKLNHEIEVAQKQFNKAQVEFETKLLEPFSKGKFNNQERAHLEEAAENINKIQDIFKACEQLRQPVVEKSLDYTKRLAKIESTVHKICLPDEIEEAVKTNNKLNERIKAIYEETSGFSESPDPEQYDSKTVSTNLLQLYSTLREEKKLLKKIQENLHIVENAPSLPPQQKLN